MKCILLCNVKNKNVMEKSRLRERVLIELENLISLSCNNSKKLQKFEQLHITLLKKYYNATDVSIDYHRNRIEMYIVIDNKAYDPRKVNTYLPILYTNLLFNNLKEFLTLCIEKDQKSIGFYAQLLTSRSLI